MSSSRTPRLSAVVMVVTVGFGLAAFGSRFLPAHLLFLMACAGTLALTAVPTSFALPRRMLWLALPAALALAINLVQILPLSPGNPLNLLLHPLWHSSHSLLGASHPTLSLHAAAGLLPLLTATTACGLFLAAASLARMGQGRVLFRGLALVITTLSLYGLVVYALGNSSILWVDKFAYQDALSATFVNRNTFATVAGTGLLLCLHGFAATLPNLPSSGRANFRQRLKVFLHVSLFKAWPWLVMAGFNLLALLLTLSRGGLAATFVALIFWWGLILIKARGGRPFWLMGGALGLALMLALLPVATHTLGPRLLKTDHSADARHSINQVSLAAHAANPWVGYGLGTYNSVYRMYNFSNPTKPNPRMVHAHNSWLETLIESGRLSAALWGLSLAGIALMLARQVHIRRTGYPAPALALGVGVLAALHSWVDFSAHNPSYMVLLAVLLGTGLGQGSTTPKSRPAASSFAVRAGATSLALALVAVTLWQAPARLATWRLETQLTPTNAARLHASISQNAQAYPSAASHSLAAHNALLIAAHQPFLQGLFYPYALRHTTAALSYAPANPYLWHQRAQLQNALGKASAAGASLTYSYLTGPSEGALAQPRYQLTQTLWPLLSPDNKASLAPHLARLTEAYAKRFPNLLP